MTVKAIPTLVVDDHITLKRFSHDADQAKYEAIIASREHLLPWLPWARFYDNPKQMEEFTESQIKAFDDGEKIGYDIFYDGIFAGSIDLHDVSEENRSAEIGYWLSFDQTGKGIMTKVTSAITGYAFNELNFHRITILAATKNTASCAIPERLGFDREGTLRDAIILDNIYYDEAVYAKIKAEQ